MVTRTQIDAAAVINVLRCGGRHTTTTHHHSTTTLELDTHLAGVEAGGAVVEAGGDDHAVVWRGGHGLAAGRHAPRDLRPGPVLALYRLPHPVHLRAVRCV